MFAFPFLMELTHETEHLNTAQEGERESLQMTEFRLCLRLMPTCSVDEENPSLHLGIIFIFDASLQGFCFV